MNGYPRFGWVDIVRFQQRYSYKHWGTLDESNRFHPGVNYFYASTGERDKLIFPADWDMGDLSELSSTRRRGRVSYQDDDVDRQYGATWLLDKVAEETGVKEDLLKVLGGNNEMVNDVLTMAYFPFIENLSYNQLSQWQKEVKAPSEHELNSVNITPLDSEHNGEEQNGPVPLPDEEGRQG